MLSVDANKAEKQAFRILSNRTLSDTTKVASIQPQLSIHVVDLNRDDFLLGTGARVVDLRTGKSGTALSEDFVTKQCSVAPRKMKIPLWNAFIAEATGGDKQLAEYLQRLCGYALTGSAKEQMLAFFSGSGGNGKGVLVNAVTDILGDYAATSPMEVFIES